MSGLNYWILALLVLGQLLSGCAAAVDLRKIESPANTSPTEMNTQPVESSATETESQPGLQSTEVESDPIDLSSDEAQEIQLELDEMLRLLEETDTEVIIP